MIKKTAGAQCILAGMIVFEADHNIDGKDLGLQLSTNENAGGFTEKFSTTEYTAKLMDASPYPDLTNSHKPGDKRAILNITKRST